MPDEDGRLDDAVLDEAALNRITDRVTRILNLVYDAMEVTRTELRGKVSEMVGDPRRAVIVLDIFPVASGLCGWLSREYGINGLLAGAQFLGFLITRHVPDNGGVMQLQFEDAETGEVIEPGEVVPGSRLPAQFVAAMGSRDPETVKALFLSIADGGVASMVSFYGTLLTMAVKDDELFHAPH